MNRLISKILGTMNYVLWLILGVIAPIVYISVFVKTGSKDPSVLAGIVLVCVLSATIICGGIALLCRIADTLDALRADLKAARE